MAVYTLLISLIVFNACSETDLSDEAFSIGNELVTTHTQLGYIDTLSVKLSTVIMDSVSTSGTGRMLIGQYTDGELGTINASTAFMLNPIGIAIDEDAVYDSLVLHLGYDDYCYGDSTQYQTLNVYPLSDEIEGNDDDGELYNNSHIYALKNKLGQITYRPKTADETLDIRLTDSLGLLLYNQLLSDEISSESDFREFLPGLAIKTTHQDGAIVGFNVEDTASYMTLYYHVNELERKEATVEFMPYNTDLQFNHIETDRTGTVLESWTEQEVDIPASQTNDMVYVQGATGVLTRVEFPSLNYFVESATNVSLLKAELYFVPVKDTYDEMGISDETVLYVTNKLSELGTTVYGVNSESAQNGTTNVDLQYHEDTYISFDVSSYFKYELLDQYYDEKNGFLLGLDNYNTTFDRLIIGGLNNKKYKPKLRVYYILYQL